MGSPDTFLSGKSSLVQRPVARNGQAALGTWPGLLAKTSLCLDRVIQLAQSFNSRAFESGFSPELSKPVGIYSILVFCSVPLGLDNAAFPFLAYAGIPVVSFGFCNVSIVCPPDVRIRWKVL